MKKKSYLTFLGVALFAVAAWATTVVYSKNVVNDPVLAVNKTYTVDLKTAGNNGRSIDHFSAQAVYSNPAYSSVSFTDGGVSTNQLTVSSASGLAAVASTNTITVTSTSTIINAQIFVQNVRLRAGYDWQVGATTALTATNIATIVNKVAGIHASAAGSVVYATATVAGTAGNAYTLTKVSASGLSLGGATFSGGIDAASIVINGTSLTFTPVATTTGTAKAISDAIMANSTLSALFHSTWTSSVVYATSTAVGVNAYACTASPSAKLVWAATTFQNGTAGAWALNGTNISKTSHGLGTGLPVLYSTGVVAISGLTNQTTYYAIRVDDNNFKLATSTTNAVAGTAIVLASTSTTGPHTYTVAPLAAAGTFSFKWQYSNDGSNWLDLSVSSVSFPSPYTASSTAWDFGAVNYRYIRVNELAGTAGAWNLVISGYGTNAN